MRVIAGTARRIQLETVKGNNTRPTTDRIKETLFNIINNDLYDIDFWICLVEVAPLELKL